MNRHDEIEAAGRDLALAASHEGPDSLIPHIERFTKSLSLPTCTCCEDDGLYCHVCGAPPRGALPPESTLRAVAEAAYTAGVLHAGHRDEDDGIGDLRNRWQIYADDKQRTIDALLKKFSQPPEQEPDAVAEARAAAEHWINFCKARLREAGMRVSVLDEIPLPGDGVGGVAAERAGGE